MSVAVYRTVVHAVSRIIPRPGMGRMLFFAISLSLAEWVIIWWIIQMVRS